MSTVIDSKDDWVTASVIVRRIKGEDAGVHSDRYFVQNIASKPDFPRPSFYGKTKVWNWHEVSEYFRKQREKQTVGRPRETGEV